MLQRVLYVEKRFVRKARADRTKDLDADCSI